MRPSPKFEQGREPGPGLVKTRELPLLRKRVVELWQLSDYRWREYFEASDVMSEGAVRADGKEHVYYGSTSIVLSLKGDATHERQHLVSALSRDPHLRVRALRVAHREAELRAGGPLSKMYSDVEVLAHEGGAAIQIEVQATVCIVQSEQVPLKKRHKA